MYPMVKRLFDLFVSVFLLVLLLPMFVVVAILIKTTEGPVFYTQTRLGKNAKTFNLFKFRSMTNKKRDVSVQVSEGSAEVTGIGKIIRRLKIDELPQLINVLKGDMSLVGPRPCLVETQKDFNEDGKKRLLVRPGLTGLAQVNGNIYLDWTQRWKFDREYVENLSLKMDISILLKTVMIVAFGDRWGKK